MKIKHYLYNSFLIENGKSKVAIDPGQNLWIFKLCSLIPKTEWESVTHILITHGDPDHHWQSDRVAQTSGAHVVCGKELSKNNNGKTLLIHPRKGGVKSWIPLENVYTMEVGNVINIDDVEIEAIKSVHGPIEVSILGFKKKEFPGPGERTGLGSMGFKITIGNKTVVNLGDSLLQKEWEGMRPDVLMLPIGGAGNNIWTMDTKDAIEAVKIISPKMVIPCHYNVPFFWIKNINPADDQHFKREVESLGITCRIMKYADEILI